VDCCECGDEPSGSGATELVNTRYKVYGKIIHGRIENIAKSYN
jgi:hypothetical protein